MVGTIGLVGNLGENHEKWSMKMKNEKNEKWSIGLIGNLGENHETRIFFDFAAFSATAHKHMYFILSLNIY